MKAHDNTNPDPDDGSVTDEILEGARSPRAWQRAAAGERLAALPSTAKRAVLERLLGDNHRAARDLAIDVAVPQVRAVPDGDLADLLLSLVEAASAERAQAAIVALRRATLAEPTPETEGLRATFLERLESTLRHDDADVRYQAIAASEVAGRAEPSYVEHLIRALDDPDDEIRSVAAQGLARIRPDGAVEAVESRYRTARGDERMHLLMALVDLRADGLTDDLLEAATRGRYRFPALRALGENGDRAAIPSLLGVARSWFGERLHKVAAAGAAARLGSEEGTALLEGFVASRRPEVRGFALECWLEVDVVRAEPLIRAAVAAAADPARGHAVTLLGRLAGEGIDDELTALTRDDDATIADAAREALESRRSSPVP